MNSIGFIKKWSIIILCNYFLLSAINGLLFMLGLTSIAKLELLIMIAASVITLAYLSHGISKLDAFIIFFIGSIAFCGFTQNYDKTLWYAGCREQLYYTIFFFVGRYFENKPISMLSKGLFPFLIVCIIGLGLYILSPPWYMNFKLQMWDNSLSDNMLLEMMRLSAFWIYPYWISYGCTIMYSYLIVKYLTQGFMNKRGIMFLLFIAFITILTQQRAPLSIIAILTLIFIVLGLQKRGKKGASLRTSILYFVILIVCMFTILLTMIDIEMLIRLLEKLKALENLSTFLNDRANLFSDFRTKTVSFFGDGIGKYSHAAFFLGKEAITDQQYLRIIYETGYWGCLGYAIIITAVIKQALKNVSYNYFEIIIITFYLLAMTGANCLSISDQHIAIFWYCCGRVYNKKLLAYKRTFKTYS